MSNKQTKTLWVSVFIVGIFMALWSAAHTVVVMMLRVHGEEIDWYPSLLDPTYYSWDYIEAHLFTLAVLLLNELIPALVIGFALNKRAEAREAAVASTD